MERSSAALRGDPLDTSTPQNRSSAGRDRASAQSASARAHVSMGCERRWERRSGRREFRCAATAKHVAWSDLLTPWARWGHPCGLGVRQMRMPDVGSVVAYQGVGLLQAICEQFGSVEQHTLGVLSHEPSSLRSGLSPLGSALGRDAGIRRGFPQASLKEIVARVFEILNHIVCTSTRSSIILYVIAFC